MIADDDGMMQIMRLTGMAEPKVWRWLERYLDKGVLRLERDKTRPSPLPKEFWQKVITKTVQ